MIDVSWLVFVVASVVLIATPGQDMILVMSRSIAQGPLAGVATAAGVSVGLVGHTMLATLGLGALLRTSDWLFIALKLVGAAYLLYLGVGLLLREARRARARGAAAALGGRLFVDGAALQPEQSQDRDLLLRVPAAVRRAVGVAPDVVDLRAGTRRSPRSRSS